MRQVFAGARIFDGVALHDGMALVVEDGRVADLVPGAGAEGHLVALNGGILAPGFLDLQVNGGGGHMLDRDADRHTLAAICAAHAGLGSLGVLPTLITETAEGTARVLAEGIAAARAGVPGFLGLHLEGPHLDPRRKGAHDPGHIRPMTDADLARLCDAARQLPVLMTTLAPEAATPAQIAALVQAGVVVSLGHSDCSHAQAVAALAAGATCVTHVFNAMSQIGNREPGLAGAALDSPVWAGLIADGIHVHAAVLRIALAAKPEGLFLVSDCMSVAGTDQTECVLGGRRILRRDGRLTLEDGTLAGADLTLPHAVRVLVRQAGASVERALAMACAAPAAVIGLGDTLGHLRPGRRADMVHLAPDFALAAVWRAGERVA